MPLVRKLEAELWEIKSSLRDKTARIIFTHYDNHIVLLHGFIKKSQKTPLKDLELAKRRNDRLRGNP
jgi:phage-related protein